MIINYSAIEPSASVEKRGPCEGGTTLTSVKDRVLALVADHFDVDVSLLSTSTAFGDDLEATSLQMVDLTIAIEEEFFTNGDVELRDEDAVALKTVMDVVEFCRTNGVEDGP